jgi:DNA sulfur modification protein DndC
MRGKQVSLFEDDRMRLDDSIQLSLDSLNTYGPRYRHWSIAYSGGKDSSATVAFVAWAIREGLVDAPETLTVLYADTRQELPPLQATAMRVLEHVRQEGHEAKVVLPPMDKRFYVYMLGYGVPPPSNTFRWCTPSLKITPMMAELEAIADVDGKFLSITGVRLGESAKRDRKIAVSCNKNSGECGQGWFQSKTDEDVADTLAPLLHWRVCHVFDWLYFEDKRHGYPEMVDIASVYGDEDVRTGCIGCPLASRDNALERLVKHDDWLYLAPLLELKPLFREMKLPKWRKRKARPARRKDGGWSKNGQRMGPLTMEARAHFFEQVMDVQRRVNEGADQGDRPPVILINEAEAARIKEMWALDMWPRRWTGDEIVADKLIPKINAVGGDLVIQPVLIGQ